MERPKSRSRLPTLQFLLSVIYELLCVECEDGQLGLSEMGSYQNVLPAVKSLLIFHQ